MEKQQPITIQGEIHRGVPILPLRDTVIFPQSILPLAVGRESTVRLLNENADRAEFIGVVTQKDAAVENPTADAAIDRNEPIFRSVLRRTARRNRRQRPSCLWRRLSLPSARLLRPAFTL